MTLAVVCSFGAMLGCSADVAAASPPVSTIVTPSGGQGDDAGTTADAATGGLQASQVAGSPLCNASSWMGCYPDDQHVTRDRECNLGADASSSLENVPLACRVQPPSGGTAATPVCGPAGTATDGMTCHGPTDCAAGYECIGNGVCRRYCCAGDCSSQNEFCDIQEMAADSSTKVPVCMPVDDCGLLDQPTDAGPCPPGETCSVVRDNGTRSCVATGRGQAGNGCDTSDCEAGLVCLGSSGARRCYVLCHTMGGSPECGHKQTCKGGLPLFLVPGVGICE
jgi:hypothetical protein